MLLEEIQGEKAGRRSLSCSEIFSFIARGGGDVRGATWDQAMGSP